MDELPDDARPPWARWLTAASIVVALVALVSTIVAVGPGTVTELLVAIGPWFAAVIAIEVAVTLADAAALRGFLGARAPRPSLLTLVKAQVAGRAINAVTPLGTLGEATKVSLLTAEVSTPRATAAVARLALATWGTGLVAIAAGAPVCAALLDLPAALAATLWIGAVVAAALVVAIAVLVRRGMLASLAGALASTRVVSRARVARWRARLADVDRRIRGADGGWGPIAWVVVSRALGVASVWVVLAALGHPPGAGVMAAIATAGVAVGAIASVVPMGIGLGEAGVGALFVALGEPAALGVTSTLARRVTLVLYAGVGLALIATDQTVARATAARRAAATTEVPTVVAS